MEEVNERGQQSTLPLAEKSKFVLVVNCGKFGDCLGAEQLDPQNVASLDF